MASYNGLGRTNYFLVKDRDEFEAFLNKTFGEHAYEVCGESRDSERVCILAREECCDWTMQTMDENGDPNDEDDYVHLADVIAPYLRDGQVAVFQSIGWEKMRYLTGSAVAVMSDGSQVATSLDDIYCKAAAEFGVDERSISAAAY